MPTQHIIIGDTVPLPGPPDYPQLGTPWLDTLTGAFKRLTPSGWETLFTLPDVAAALRAHVSNPAAHPKLGDVAFVGLVELEDGVSSGGAKGLSGTWKIGGYALTFTHGILTGCKPLAPTEAEG